MQKCLECNTVYDLSDDHLKYIAKGVEEKAVCETIAICPECKKRRIIGGEEDLIEEESGVMIFGRKFNSDDISRGLREFEGMLIEN